MRSRTPRSPGISADCRARLEQIFAYLDDELPTGRCRALERHLAGCACCGALAESLRASMAACRVAGRQALPPQELARAKRRVRALLKERHADGSKRG